MDWARGVSMIARLGEGAAMADAGSFAAALISRCARSEGTQAEEAVPAAGAAAAGVQGGWSRWRGAHSQPRALSLLAVTVPRGRAAPCLCSNVRS